MRPDQSIGLAFLRGVVDIESTYRDSEPMTEFVGLLFGKGYAMGAPVRQHDQELGGFGALGRLGHGEAGGRPGI